MRVSASWASSSRTVARVSSIGVMTGAGRGTTTITASSGAVNGTTSATVDASSIAALNILPAGKLANLTNYQMRAVAVFKDPSSLDVTHTPGIAWSSSNSAVASIAPSTGLALPVGPPSPTASASLGQTRSTSL